MRTRWQNALPFEAFLAAADNNAALWNDLYRRASVPTELVQRAADLQSPWHLLALAEDWCGDAVNSVPVIARLAQLSGALELRVIGRDENPDLMDTHLTGTSRSIPVIMALDADFVEHGWWGPRPAALQQWFLSVGRTTEKDARYREMRAWYARDHGVSTITEVLDLLEGAENARGDHGEQSR